MRAGRVSGQSDIVSHGRRNTSLCSALLIKEGLKPSLATTIAKASERVVADPLAWERRIVESHVRRPVSRVAGKAGDGDRRYGLKPSLVATRAKASKRVAADPSGREDARKGMEKRPVPRSSFPRSRPGTQCHTSATSLRKQISKLLCKRPHIRGGAQGCAPPP